MHELFRFIAVQGPPVASKGGLIDGGKLIAGSELAKKLNTTHGADRADVAVKYMAGTRFVKGAEPGLRALLHLSSAFKGRKAVTQEAFKTLIQQAMGQPMCKLVADPAFKEFTQRLAESLLACRQAGTAALIRQRGQLALALRVIHAIEAVAGDTEQMGDILARPWAQMIVFDGVASDVADDSGGRNVLASGGTSGAGEPEMPPEHPVSTYHAELAAAIKQIDEAIPELYKASVESPSQLDRDDLPDEDEPDLSEVRNRPGALGFIAGLLERLLKSPRVSPARPSVRKFSVGLREEQFSEGTQQLLRQCGLSMRYLEDFAGVEDSLNNLRADLSSRIRRMERRSRSTRRNVPGGSIAARAADPTTYFPPGTLYPYPGTIKPDAGTPGMPRTVGTAKVIEGLLMRVEDKVVGYEAGAIAKIVNIPAAATTSIETQILTRTEETTETETGETSSMEQSVETEERFALQSETETEISLEMSAKAAGGFSASYGPVSAEGSAEASTTFGMHSATNTASDYAKSVIEKAVSRLVKTKRETVRRTRVMELRDLQKEGFDNTGGGNATAIYQWVDEVHEGQLLNYGARLMLEFQVPQPGAVLLWSMTSEAAQKDLPQPPPPFDISLADIEPGGLADLIEDYGATDIPPAPPYLRFVSKAIKIAEDLKEDPASRKIYIATDESLVVPEGYQVSRFWARLAATRPRSYNATVSAERYAITVGALSFELRANRTLLFTGQAELRSITGMVPVTIVGTEDRAVTAIVIVACERTRELLDQWRTEVYVALQNAHQRRVEEYEDRLRIARVRGGLSVQARNPAQNRAIERDEIKRSAISILTAQHFEAFGAIGFRGQLEIPNIRFDEAAIEGEYIQFFESAFEWMQTEYILYPYFWANPTANWLDALKLQMDDTLHESFLRAGAARVVVPVRLGFEAAVLTYLSHPEGPVLWNGQEYEDIDMDSEMYFPIWRAIMEQQGQTETTPIPEGDPWRFRIPTNYQIINSSGQLPAPP